MSGIGKCLGVEGFFGVLVLPLNGEILSHSLAVVGRNKLAHHFGEGMLFRKFQSVVDVVDDDARTTHFIKVIMGIHARLILGEEHRILQFTNIVVQGPHTSEKGFRPNGTRHFGGEVTHLNRVIERTLCLTRHAAQESFVEVHEFDERHTGSKPKDALNEIHQGVSQELESATDSKVYVTVVVKTEDVVPRTEGQSTHEVETEAHKPCRKNIEECHAQHLRALGHFLE